MTKEIMEIIADRLEGFIRCREAMVREHANWLGAPLVGLEPAEIEELRLCYDLREIAFYDCAESLADAILALEAKTKSDVH